ncbi:hypothetical protein M9434_004639 [Picochlorum sp. BPE23]|nr:hypothetical protein M9434_004639 [Picochlorum sp. BPE23]
MSGSAELRRLKASHLKKRGDSALHEANYKVAKEMYSQAIALSPSNDVEVLKKLFSNRSLTHFRTSKYAEALQDADAALEMAPRWAKGHWRRGTALVGMGRLGDAVDAFAQARTIENSEECDQKLKEIIRSMHTEALASKLLDLLDKSYQQGALAPPRQEIADDLLVHEGAYILINKTQKSARSGSQSGSMGTFGETCYSWTIHGGPSPFEAYIFRSRVSKCCKCFLQAREDATLALSEVSKSVQWDKTSDTISVSKAATAYVALGEAFLAESGHPDRDAFRALKALRKAIDCGCDDQNVYDAFQEATESLSKEQVEQAMLEVYAEGSIMSAQREQSRLVGVVVLFPTATPRSMNSYCREMLRWLAAEALNVDKASVALERIRAAKHGELHVSLSVSIPRLTKEAAELQQDLVAFWASKQGSRDMDLLISHLGEPDLGSLDVSVVSPGAQSGEEDIHTASQEGTLTQPSAPKTELDVPYRHYRLVDSLGNPAKRAQKHAFCMSRVYYNRAEIQQETWVELGDGSCRWRQSGSEVRIIVLGVPPHLPAKQLEVDIQPYYISIKNRADGSTYLEGKLHRGVIPDSSFWTQLGGKGEDGLCITLAKMNLEVLHKHWMHSEMWWSKLFENHAEIAWDDYEKDYSDLPEEVLERHYVTEAKRDEQKQVERVDEKRRKRLTEADDVRKKNRMLALAALRDG